MTDEELIQYLRTTPGWPTLGNAAADRIEALIRERDALTDALAEAEAERNFWRQAAAKGSIHTQRDLERAAQEAREVALQETEDAVRAWLYECPTHESLADVILGLMGAPVAEALERVRAEERENCAKVADQMAEDALTDRAREHAFQIAAAIRARGET